MPTYRIEGKGRESGRRRKRLYQAVDRETAISLAEQEGTVVEEVVELPPDPPTGYQVAHARELGVSLPRGVSLEEAADLISAFVEDDRNPPSSDELQIAKQLNVLHTQYTGRRELHTRIYNHLIKQGDEKAILQWFVWRVYRDRMQLRGSSEKPRPWDDPVLKKIAAELSADPKVVQSAIRYADSDLSEFGERTDSNGYLREGGSRRALAYKQAAALLERRIPGLARNRASTPKASRKSSDRIEKPSAASSSKGCLGVVLLGLALPAALLAGALVVL